MGSSALSLTLLLMSFIHSGLTQDLPKTELTVDPKSPVFTGERVNLKCVIESDHSDWRYEWYKDRDSVKLQTSEHYTVNTDTLTIRGATESDQDQFWCRGQRDGRPSSSQESNRIDLAVNDLPTSKLTVTPNSVFTGERVILTCEITPYYSDWRYEWNKDNTEVSESYTNTLTIEQSKTSDAGRYTCRGHIDGRSVSSQSSSVSLSVEDLPTPTLTVTPDSPVFTGERVSLTCVIISDHSDWRYEWNKDRTKVSERHTVNGNTLTIERSETSDAGLYTCKGHIDGRSVSSQSSSASLSVRERPKPEVKVTPDERVFRGETVTLTCDIQGAGDIQWTYSWFKAGNTFYPYTTTAEISFRADYVSYGVKYSCRGERSDSQRSHISDAVTLTVSALPRSTLTVTPNSPVFTGERVSLKCVINSDHSDWRYEWNKDSTEVSERHTVNRNTLTIERSKTSDAGRYTCRGHIDRRSVSSQSSSAVYLSVKDLPTSTLTVTPDSPVFTGERVILKCVITSYYSDWRYEWYKDSTEVSERHTVKGNTLTIERSETSDSGLYTCKGQRDGRPKSSQSSSAVSLSVKHLPRSTLTVTPDSPVFTGERVNLTCVINSDHSDWRYEWYKGGNNSVMLQTSERYTLNRDTLTISGATESDQDQFWCRGQRDEKPNSSKESERINLSVNASRSAQISVFNILSFLLAACPYLLATVVLLFKCCRARVISTEDQSQYVVTEE